MKLGIIGGSGYVGGELLRILLSHPEADVSLVTSRRHKGEYVFRLHPNLRGLTDLQFQDQGARSSSECDLVFSALPHGDSLKIMPELIETGVRIIDLSADFRLKRPEDYERFYGHRHPNPELLERFTYGIPELYHNEIKKSRLVACSGCMAITSILALAPIAKSGLMPDGQVIIDAKIGSSGAGTKLSVAAQHAERTSVIRPYKPTGHRHTAEIDQELSRLSGQAVKVSLSTHGVNIVRGILCTSHLFLDELLEDKELWKIYRSFYGNAPFIRLVKDSKGLQRYPDPKYVIGSNFCDIGFEVDTHSNRLVLLSATDNLMKGAAGSAVQCMNMMFGLEETAGLRMAPIRPI